MLQKRRVVPLAVLTAALAACSPAQPTPQPAALPQGIQGTLTVGVGGEALAGATIEALTTDSKTVVAKTSSDASGHFSLPLAPGRYTLLSPGQILSSTVNQGGTGMVPFASSRAVGVSVLDKTFTTFNLVQVPAIASSTDTTPPTLDIGGLGNTLDGQGTAEFTYTAHSNGGNSIYLIYASVGTEPRADRLGRGDRKLLYIGGPGGETQLTADVTDSDSLDLRRFAAGLSGGATFYGTVIDSNNNRSVYLIPVTVSNPVVGSAPTTAVQDVNATAFTVSNTRINLQRAGQQSAPAGALVYAEVSWTPFAFPALPDGTTPALGQGYHIYRSINGGPSTLVGNKAVYLGAGADGKPAVINPGSWQDADPALAPGVQATYTVRAFSGTQEGPASAASTATVLPVLKVNLTAPAENAQDVSTTPTFTWQTNGVGAYEYFVPALSDSVNGAGISSCGTEPTATPPSPLVDLLQQATLTSARGFGFSGTLCGVVGGTAASTYSFDYHPGADYNSLLIPLQEGRSYQWRLLEAVATDSPTEPHGISVAFDAAGLLFDYNVYTGLYTFDGDQVFTFTTGGTK